MKLLPACLIFALSLSAQKFPDHVGKVDFSKPCSFLFFRKDAHYSPGGDILVRQAIVWNTGTDLDGNQPLGVVVGELPPVPRGIPEPDTSKPMQPILDSRKCKGRDDGRADCRDVTLRPTMIRVRK